MQDPSTVLLFCELDYLDRLYLYSSILGSPLTNWYHPKRQTKMLLYPLEFSPFSLGPSTLQYEIMKLSLSFFCKIRL
jgi:hypothetical protein